MGSRMQITLAGPHHKQLYKVYMYAQMTINHLNIVLVGLIDRVIKYSIHISLKHLKLQSMQPSVVFAFR